MRKACCVKEHVGSDKEGHVNMSDEGRRGTPCLMSLMDCSKALACAKATPQEPSSYSDKNFDIGL